MQENYANDITGDLKARTMETDPRLQTLNDTGKGRKVWHSRVFSAA